MDGAIGFGPVSGSCFPIAGRGEAGPAHPNVAIKWETRCCTYGTGGTVTV